MPGRTHHKGLFVEGNAASKKKAELPIEGTHLLDLDPLLVDQVINENPARMILAADGGADDEFVSMQSDRCSECLTDLESGTENLPDGLPLFGAALDHTHSCCNLRIRRASILIAHRGPLAVDGEWIAANESKLSGRERLHGEILDALGERTGSE